MKRKLVWVLVAAVLVTVIIMVWPDKSGPRPQVELSFLGFSNSPARSEAAFAVYLPPRFGGCGWRQMEVDVLEEGRWTHVTSQAPGMQQYRGGYPGAKAPNGRPFDWITVLPIANTNNSWRFRLAVDELPRRAPFVIELWRDLVKRGRRVQGFSPARSYDYSYWITNEVHPAGSGK
jgi:hypothetical protein